MGTFNLGLFLILSSLFMNSCSRIEDPIVVEEKSFKVKELTAGWPFSSRQAADSMIEKYGPPTEATSSKFTWYEIAPFKRIVVYNEEVTHKFPLLHKDVIEHVVDYKVPLDSIEELAKFNGSVFVDRTRGELSARCNTEAMNLLTLNLASDIISKRIQAAEARKESGRQAVEYLNGNKIAYMEKLHFFRKVDTADADQGAPMDWSTAPAQAQEAWPESKTERENREILEKAQKEEITE